jgi:hypothetical protein
MSKFSTKAKPVYKRNETVNQEGAVAYNKTATEELYSALVSSFLNGDKFYESEETTLNRILNLVTELNDENQKKFLIGLAYLTRKLGNRTSFHYVTALIGQIVKDEPAAIKNLIKYATERPDDLIEIAAAWANYFGKIENRPYKNKKGQPNKITGSYKFPSLKGMPRTIRDGIARAFEKFDSYQISKYKGENKSIKLKDLVCFCHPKSDKCKAGQEVIKQLLDGTLPPAETWETKLSNAGSDKTEKKKAWESLLKEDKVGYMALLRNIRNFIETDVDQNLWVPKLASKDKVLKSKQFPFRFLSAYKAISAMYGFQNKNILSALSKAIGYSCENIPDMTGNTLIAVDLSGSMSSSLSSNSSLTYMEVGANFGSMLYEKSDKVVVYGFGESIKKIDLGPNSGVLENANKIMSTNVGHSTNGYMILKDMLSKTIKVDRAVFFTDCVLWDSYGNTNIRDLILKYWEKINPNANFWFIDLSGYKTTVDSGDKRIHLLAGFNENILRLIPKGEETNSISEDIIRLCENIYDKLNKGEFPPNVKELFEELN